MSNPCRLDDTTQNKIAYAMGYEKGRADAIEEYNKKIKECCHIVGSCDFEDLERIAEQLKGENRMIIDSEQEQVKIYDAYYNKGYKKGYADGSLSVTEEIRSKVIDDFVEWLNKHHNYGKCVIDMYVEEYREVLKEKSDE